MSDVPRSTFARVRAAALTFALGCGLAGCISSAGIAPSAQPLDATKLGTDSTFAAWPEERWWEAFGDADLNHLVEQALAANPDMTLARARIAQADAAIGYTHSRLLPQVSFGAQATAQRYSEQSLYPDNIGGEFKLETTAELSATYEFDFFGRNHAAIAAATSMAQASAAAQQAARVALASRVAHVYFELARFLGEREVAVATRVQRENILKLVQARVAQGLDSNVELRQAEGALPQIDGDIALLDENIELMRSALAELAVSDLASTANLAPKLNAVQAPALPATIPSDLLARRADVTAARWRVEALMHGTEIVKAEFYPRVNLTAFGGLSAVGLSSLFDLAAGMYGISPSVSLPIFDGDRLRSKLKLVDAEVDYAVGEYNASLLAALKDVVHVVTSLRALEQRRAAQAAAQAAAESAYDIALQRYKAGLTGYLTVLSTESDVLKEHRAATALRARALSLEVDLNHALGGGFNSAALTASN